MATPRYVCHRCRTKWKVKTDSDRRECPKCGWDNVGPTDPARGFLGKLVLVALIAVGGAYYLGMIPGTALEDAREAVESTVDEVRQEVEERVGEPESPTPPRTTPTPRRRRPAPRATPTPPASAAERPAAAEVVVRSKSGALVGSAYWVKGKVENRGGAPAEELRVIVTFREADGTSREVPAQCPDALEPGAAARYEAAVSGDQAARVEDFTVAVELTSAR